MRLYKREGQKLENKNIEESKQGPFTILVIENDPDDFELIKNHLDNIDLRLEIKMAESISSIKKALNDNNIDLILCDYKLDDVTGKEVLKMVKNSYPRHPFVVVSGYLSANGALEIMRLGASDCVLKDNLEQLIPVVKRELTHREYEKQLLMERDAANYQLRERMKEQQCLYKISTIDVHDKSIKTLLFEAVNYLPDGFQYPEITAAKVSFDGLEYKTDNYRNTPWSISSENKSIKFGPLKFTVVYLEEKPELDYGPFMSEENTLLELIVNQMSIKINRKLDKKEFDKRNELLKRSNELAQVGYWEVNTTQNEVTWGSEVKEILEIDQDFSPTLEEGISFYKEGKDREIAYEIYNNAVENGEHIDEELRVVTAKGNQRWVRVIGEPDLIDGTCVRVFGSFQDITNKKEHIFKLEQERKRLQEVQRIGEIGDWDYDLETEQIDWSDQIYEIYGRDLESGPPSYNELLNYYRDDGEQLHSHIRRITDSGGEYRLDLEIVTEQGQHKYVYHEGYAEADEENNIIRLHGIVQNITQRKQRELEIIRRESQMRTITNNVDAVVFRYILRSDGSDEMKFVTENINRLYEVDASEVIETTNVAWDLIVPEDVEPLKWSIDESAETLEKWNHRFRVKTASGQMKWIEGHAYPVKKDDDSVQWDVMVLDVTQQVEQERVNDMLVQEIHHRVKNNLAIISSFLQMQLLELENEREERIPLQRAVNRIYSIAEIHKLLYEGSNLVDINPKDYFSRLFDHNISNMSFDTDVKVDLHIHADRMNVNELTPLGMLINELITNSLKYAFQNSEEGIIQLSIDRNEDSYQVTYCDNGIGIESSKIKSGSGSGLKIVELLLKQLEADYNMDTKDQFRLDFSFNERVKGSQSHHNILQRNGE